MATSQVSDVRQALVAIFAGAGHTAFAYPPGDTAGSRAYAYLETVRTDQEHLTFGGQRQETMMVDGVIYVWKAGANDAVAKDAEDTALAILDDLEIGLVTTSNLGDADVFHGQLVETVCDVTANADDRVALVRFTVQVQADITPA